VNDKTRRTLVPRLSAGALSSVGSGLLAVLFVVFLVIGCWKIYEPAGWFAAAVGMLALQYQFFGGRDSG
jgi:hypothetical protein